ALLGGLAIPLARPRQVRVDADAEAIEGAEFILGVGIAGLGCPFRPARRGGKVFIDALASAINSRDREHRGDVAGPGRLFVPGERLRRRSWLAFSEFGGDAEIVLCRDISLTRGQFEPEQGLFEILRHTLAVKKEI